MGTFFQLEMDKAAKRRGMDSAFHLLCPGYSKPLLPTDPLAVRLKETFTFTSIEFLIAF